MKNFILKIIGTISLTLGVLGAFLPLLPSTCFILLSTWAFSKSSPRFHAWLYYHSPFSTSIQNWQQHRVIPKRVKVIATLSLITSFSITAFYVSNPALLMSLAVGMAILLVYLLSRSSESLQSRESIELHNLESPLLTN